MSAITVGVSTRNRPAALARCVQSLARLESLSPAVLVFDDASDPPAATAISPDGLPSASPRIIRDSRGVGHIVGRNRMVREAATPFVLLLDDDAVILSEAPIRRALSILQRDPQVVAVAFAQGEADGQPWPAIMQPGRGARDSYVAAFIGFAHLVRRDAFLALGGYRESLVFYGEEKEFCLRALEAGLHVVYLPDAVVGHIQDPAGRSAVRYVRFAIRNDCLHSLYNEPWLLAAAAVPLRLWRFRRMSAAGERDPGGLRWILSELRRLLPDVWRHRRPVAWSTVRRWRRLTRTEIPYSPPRCGPRSADHEIV